MTIKTTRITGKPKSGILAGAFVFILAAAAEISGEIYFHEHPEKLTRMYDFILGFLQ